MEKEKNAGQKPEIGLMEKIVSLAKRRGFVFPGSEIYGGLAGTWDYGPLGALLNENIKAYWRKKFLDEREDITEYIRNLEANQPLDEKEIRAGYERFKAEKKIRELAAIAYTHGLDAAALQAFVDEVLSGREVLAP